MCVLVYCTTQGFTVTDPNDDGPTRQCAEVDADDYRVPAVAR
jgi:hypothetical protein